MKKIYDFARQRASSITTKVKCITITCCAVIFSAVITIIISQADNHVGKDLSEGLLDNSHRSLLDKSRPTETFDASERLQYELERLRDPATGKIPSNIRKLELEYAATFPGYWAMGVETEKNPASTTFNNLQTLNWQSRGPWNVGGRTRAFAIDITNENKILAGSTSGGMYSSLNGGASWNQTWGIAHQSVSCISQDIRTGKTNIWYAGTGEGYGQSASAANAYYLGNGLYKSTDGGQTWNSLTATTSGTPQTFDNVWDVIWNVATNPADTNDVVYAATYGAIWKSTDGGTTWTVSRGNATAPPFSYFTDVAVTSSGIIYATLSSDGSQKGIWRSSNGTTWTNITPQLNFPTTYGRTVIGISPSDENQIYFLATVTTNFGTPDTNFLGDVEWNSLWKYKYISGDGSGTGGKWDDLSANLPTTGGPFDKFYAQGGYDAVVKVYPTDTAIVFIGGTNLYRSTSGFFNSSSTAFIGGYQQGATLPVVNVYLNHHPDQHQIAFLPSNPSVMFSANDGGIFKTTNNSAPSVSWASLNNGYITTMFYTTAIDHASSNDSTIIGGAQDNGSWFVNSNNPAATWVTPRGGDGSYCAIANGKSNYYFSIQNGKMMKATLNPSGQVLSFARIDPIGGTGYLFINPYILDPNNNNRMYLAGGKNLWRNDSLNFIPMLGNWDSISNGWLKFQDTVPASGSKITALAVSKNPANVLYYGTSRRNIYRIDNSNTGTPQAVDITGTNFPLNGTYGAYISSIAVNPLDSKKIMVSFSNYNVYSVFYSENADSTAPTWTKVAGNLEQNSNTTGGGNGPSVRWLSIMPVSDGIVYLAATSTGLYATDTLIGASTIWVQQGAGTIGNSICDMIDFRTADGLVSVATHSRGIFTTHITSKNDITTGINEFTIYDLPFTIYPNPFQYSTTINFSLNKNSKVKITIYDVNGRILRTLADKEFPAGEQHIDFSGETLKSGVYFCVVKTGEAVETKKILLIK